MSINPYQINFLYHLFKGFPMCFCWIPQSFQWILILHILPTKNSKFLKISDVYFTFLLGPLLRHVNLIGMLRFLHAVANFPRPPPKKKKTYPTDGWSMYTTWKGSMAIATPMNVLVYHGPENKASHILGVANRHLLSLRCTLQISGKRREKFLLYPDQRKKLVVDLWSSVKFQGSDVMLFFNFRKCV